MSASTPRRLKPGGPGPVVKWQIGSHQVEDVGSVRAIGTGALEVGLAAEFVRERPPHSIGDESAFDAEDDVSKEWHPPGRPDVAAHPSRGARVCVEKPSERGSSLP